MAEACSIPMQSEIVPPSAGNAKGKTAEKKQDTGFGKLFNQAVETNGNTDEIAEPATEKGPAGNADAMIPFPFPFPGIAILPIMTAGVSISNLDNATTQQNIVSLPHNRAAALTYGIASTKTEAVMTARLTSDGSQQQVRGETADQLVLPEPQQNPIVDPVTDKAVGIPVSQSITIVAQTVEQVHVTSTAQQVTEVVAQANNPSTIIEAFGSSVPTVGNNAKSSPVTPISTNKGTRQEKQQANPQLTTFGSNETGLIPSDQKTVLMRTNNSGIGQPASRQEASFNQQPELKASTLPEKSKLQIVDSSDELTMMNDRLEQLASRQEASFNQQPELKASTLPEKPTVQIVDSSDELTMMNDRLQVPVYAERSAVFQTTEATTVTDDVTAAFVSDPHHVVDQIVEQARMINRPHNSEMVVKLKPEHLGELTLKVTVESGVVSASFHSNNPEVRSVIEASLPQLRQELSTQGLKVEYVGVYTGLNQFSSNSQQQSTPQQVIKVKNRRDGEEITDFVEAISGLSLGGQDGVDYRI